MWSELSWHKSVSCEPHIFFCVPLLNGLCTLCFSHNLVINCRSQLTDSSNHIKGDALSPKGEPRNREDNPQKHLLQYFLNMLCLPGGDWEYRELERNSPSSTELWAIVNTHTHKHDHLHPLQNSLCVTSTVSTAKRILYCHNHEVVLELALTYQNLCSVHFSLHVIKTNK